MHHTDHHQDEHAKPGWNEAPGPSGHACHTPPPEQDDETSVENVEEIMSVGPEEA